MRKDQNRFMIWLVMCLSLCLSSVGYSQCTPPTLVQIKKASVDSVQVSWFYFGDATGWEMELVPFGQSPTLTPTTPLITEQEYTFHDLQPAYAYTVFIRTVCETGVSQWNPVAIRTAIPQPSPCLFDLPIKNNNCGQGLERFAIEVTNIDGLLGEDVFLSAVDLMIEHPWPADLDIRLQSPDGLELSLSRHHGTVFDNYGNIEKGDCTEPTRFSDQACTLISDATPPFIGHFLPESPIFEIENGTTPNGTWNLRVCDRSNQDEGFLKYVQLHFEPLLCEVPRDIIVKSVSATSVEVTWTSFDGCEGAEVELSLAGETPGSISTTNINCQTESIIIDDLTPDTEYDIYVLASCVPNLRSPLSCPFTFKTACDEVTLVESFDDLETCVPGCAFPCSILGVWANENDDDQDWIIWNTQTDTKDTGPRTGAFDGGNYLYVESSPDICMPQTKTVLSSSCIEIQSNSKGCDLSFWYHMLGSDIGTLSVYIQTNESGIWEPIWSATGSQGADWKNTEIDLSAYQGMAAQFRFEAETSDGTEGDIALDQIEFRGSIHRPQGYTYFADEDNDGFGDEAQVLTLCSSTPPVGFVTLAGDCNDVDSLINPMADEIVCNTIDENCNGMDDDNPSGNSILFDINITAEKCTQPSSGSISIENISGNPPFEVAWNNGHIGPTLLGVSTGYYTLTITDGSNCAQRIDSIFLPLENDIAISIVDVSPASCQGQEDGQAVIAVNNGAAPYTYIWLSSPSQNDTLKQATAGIHKLLATDANGCMSDTFTVTIPAAGTIDAAISFSIDARCQDEAGGLLQAQALSGTAPYTYVWEDGTTGPLLSNISAGTYVCTVTDALGCNTVVEGTITAPTELQAEIVSQENVECFGELTGSIKTNVSGGTPPYTFSWNTGQVTDDVFDLPAGMYLLTVTDAQACRVVADTVTISQPPLLTAIVDSAVAATCILSQDGYISIKAGGGVAPYNYFWSHTSLDTSDLQDIQAGTYSATITDANNCKVTVSNYDLMSTDTPIDISLQVAGENLCPRDSLVSIIADASNGTYPLDFNWNVGLQTVTTSPSDTLSLLPAGEYFVTVTDVNGCLGYSDTIVIPTIEPIRMDIAEKKNNICHDDTLGRVTVITTGGTFPYTYTWSTGDTTPSAQNLPVGTYRVSILDDNGCEFVSQNISITSPPPFDIDIDVTHSTGEADGSIVLEIEGGLPPYTVQWDDDVAPIGSTTASQLLPDSYGITITDTNDCDSTFVVEVSIIDNVKDISLGVNIFPNPTQDILFINGAGVIDQLDLYTMSGEKVTDLVTISSNSMYEVHVEKVPVGIYILSINIENQILRKKLIIAR